MPARGSSTISVSLIALAVSVGLTACQPETTETVEDIVEPVFVDLPEEATARPEIWPAIEPLPLDPEVEARIDRILAMMTVEQKVGQTIQADSGAVTPEQVRDYRLGSVLSGGNSAPGPLPYADAQTWLDAADAYFNASLDPEGVEIAIPIIWGIDAVHGHANLRGAVIFPHNIGLGAANNPDLIEEIYRITARELSVSGHDWTFAPTLAVPRDDRWGRTYEGFSEDPEIVRAYGERIVWGLQGRPGTDDFMATGRVISSAKHFLADGGTVDGRDQGDAQISEEELRDIHAQGYYTAIPAGVQTVMVSFSGWNDVRMHGNQSLVTDVLRDRMGFTGFVVGDWNGHGLVRGCTATDCPESFNAGVDMYMAPGSWQALYYNTLEHVRAGRISMQRLDEAVRRILRVKIQSGLFEQVAPSQRPLANDMSVLAAEEHRAVARQAVRESLVLLKNEDNLLPLDPGATVLVVGDGAASIGKASGGWTLSWQGGTHHPNSEFPAGQSILDGIQEAVTAAGGTVIFNETGDGASEADVVIAVYGEDPYAEFQGDRDHLDFISTGFETERLNTYRETGTAVVSVFLSGRPMWTNPEINASDAFIAAWLPGTEGGGIADMLFRTNPDFEFTGRLSYSWPATAVGGGPNRNDGQPALFEYGYGLSYADTVSVGELPEESGLSAEDLSPNGAFYIQGQAASPWTLEASEGDSWFSTEAGVANSAFVSLGQTDRTAQEDSIQFTWRQAGGALRLVTEDAVDLSRESNGEMEISFRARSFDSVDVWVEIGMASTDGRDHFVPIQVTQGPWQEYRVSLSCFAQAGVDVSDLQAAFILRSDESNGEIGLGDIILASDTDAAQTCGDER